MEKKLGKEKHISISGKNNKGDKKTLDEFLEIYEGNKIKANFALFKKKLMRATKKKAKNIAG